MGKSRKVLCNEGEKGNRGESCLCLVCPKKRFRYKKYSDYRRVLQKALDNAKHKFYHGKFKETEGNLKKKLGKLLIKFVAKRDKK